MLYFCSDPEFWEKTLNPTKVGVTIIFLDFSEFEWSELGNNLDFQMFIKI